MSCAPPFLSFAINTNYFLSIFNANLINEFLFAKKENELLTCMKCSLTFIIHCRNCNDISKHMKN